MKRSRSLSSPSALERIRSRFLRRIVSDLDAFILPDLRSGDAKERAAFSGLVLSRFAAEGDVVPLAFTSLQDAFEDEVARSRDLIAAVGLGDLIPAVIPVAPETIAERVFGLRTILGRCVRQLSAVSPAHPAKADIRQRLDAIFALELAWTAAQKSTDGGERAAAPVAPSVYQRVTPETVTGYLRSRFPSAPGIVATSVEVLPGGRSKKTIFIALGETNGVLPPRVVMRQDTGLTHMGTQIADEVPILGSLIESDLPIPEIYHVEPAETALGPPFLLMRRLAGRPTGDFTAFSAVDAGFVIETARALAQLHDIDPAAAGLAQGEPISRLVAAKWQQWRDDAIEPSPLIDYAFHWVSAQCDVVGRGGAIVHGDYRPHNLLAEDGHLTGVLDWEFAHVGDPAEDLAYFRPTVTPVMNWTEFLGHYEAAGGQACDEEILRFYDVWGVLRLAALGAGAVRGFLDGATDDFTQGAGGYFVIPMFERRLAELLPAPGGRCS